MYKYFEELEKKKEFKTYLVRGNIDIKREYSIKSLCLTDNLLDKYEELFERLKILDMFIEGHNEILVLKSLSKEFRSYEDWSTLSSFFEHKEENYQYIKYLKRKININNFELTNMLQEYLIYSNHLIEMMPSYKDFILSTRNMIKNVLAELKIKSIIQMPSYSKKIDYIWPDAWYITPNGYLYNTGTGHQEGNLQYPFYYVIGGILKQNDSVPELDYSMCIKAILENGYITYEDFQNYCHLIYELPTVITPEVEHDIARKKNILKMSKEEFEKIVASEFYPYPDRSYQKNLITLIIGYFAAKTSLFKAFTNLNDSNRKKEIYNKLFGYSLDEIFVRYCGFHKVSSVLERTITTSSLNKIEYFKDYLDKGWNLDVVPGIIYDKTKDDLQEVDFNSYYIDKYLDKILSQYDGKGKILIKGKIGY